MKRKEVPCLGVKSELQLPAYSTTTATQDPSQIFNPHHSSQQHQILNPLSEARDRTYMLTDTIRFVFTEPQQELPGNFSCTEKKSGSSRCGAAETNPTRKHEVSGSIPDLSQWVKNLVLEFPSWRSG